MSRGILQAVIATLLGLVIGVGAWLASFIAVLRPEATEAPLGSPDTTLALAGSRLAIALVCVCVGVFTTAFLAPKHHRFLALVRFGPAWLTGGFICVITLSVLSSLGLPVWALVIGVAGSVAFIHPLQLLAARVSRRGRIAGPST